MVAFSAGTRTEIDKKCRDRGFTWNGIVTGYLTWIEIFWTWDRAGYSARLGQGWGMANCFCVWFCACFCTSDIQRLLSIPLSIFLAFHLSVSLSIYLSVHPSICLSIYPSLHLSIYLSICSDCARAMPKPYLSRLQNCRNYSINVPLCFNSIEKR